MLLLAPGEDLQEFRLHRCAELVLRVKSLPDRLENLGGAAASLHQNLKAKRLDILLAWPCNQQGHFMHSASA